MAWRGVPEHPADLRYEDDLVTADEEAELLSRFATSGWNRMPRRAVPWWSACRWLPTR
ncbi:MAG: hypothetical protein K0R30_2428 [Ornithinibacter sp.]|nr:hypothetical protein [Ornithinibacter sp.]